MKPKKPIPDAIYLTKEQARTLRREICAHLTELEFEAALKRRKWRVRIPRLEFEGVDLLEGSNK